MRRRQWLPLLFCGAIFFMFWNVVTFRSLPDPTPPVMPTLLGRQRLPARAMTSVSEIVPLAFGEVRVFSEDVAMAGKGEDQFALSRFFQGRADGVFLEVGAYDGHTHSTTFAFERALQWNGVLIEGSPRSMGGLRTNRPRQTLINTAVCDPNNVPASPPGAPACPVPTANDTAWIHYLVDRGEVNGIAEYMSAEAMQRKHGGADARSLECVQCAALSTLLGQVNMRFADFFSLNVEGGELAALQTLDFNRVRFGVIAVASNEGNEPIIELLSSHGYRYVGQNLSSNWFVSREYESVVLNENVMFLGKPVNGRAKSLESEKIPLIINDAPFDKFHEDIVRSSMGQDQYALKTFFVGKEEGFFVEVGVGMTYSNTFAFEHGLGWRGALVDAGPGAVRRLEAKRPLLTLIGAAICRPEELPRVFSPACGGGASSRRNSSFLHYMSGTDGGKFVEFSPTTDAMVGGKSQCVPCARLSTLLKPIAVKFVDFLSLNVNGGELNVLESLDFYSLRFGVIAVQQHGAVTIPAMVALLERHNYMHVAAAHTMDWFISRDYKDYALKLTTL